MKEGEELERETSGRLEDRRDTVSTIFPTTNTTTARIEMRRMMMMTTNDVH